MTHGIQTFAVSNFAPRIAGVTLEFTIHDLNTGDVNRLEGPRIIGVAPFFLSTLTKYGKSVCAKKTGATLRARHRTMATDGRLRPYRHVRRRTDHGSTPGRHRVSVLGAPRRAV